MGTDLFQMAYNAYLREVGIDYSKPLYILRMSSEYRSLVITVDDLQRNVGLLQQDCPELLELFVAADDGRYLHAELRVVIESVRPLACPDEEVTTETDLHFYSQPRWVGDGAVVEYGPSGYVYYRFKFDFCVDPQKPDVVEGGDLQFVDDYPLDHQPGIPLPIFPIDH